MRADPQPARSRRCRSARPSALFRDRSTSSSAVRGYADRDRVHLHTTTNSQARKTKRSTQPISTAAAGKTTIVIAQTSNDHIDALNARAQAIRRQAGELGDDGLPIPGRPYQLREGDLIQVRHTIHHPDHGPLRNGTAAQVVCVDSDVGALELRLPDATEITLTEQQIATADLRLAYVGHPFPAQGHTTDTTHLIVGEHATREGTYVGLTRARESTNLYASDSLNPSPDGDRLQSLADHVSRTEPDLPSIRTPLAPEPQLDRRTRARAARGMTLESVSQLDPASKAEPAPIDPELDLDRGLGAGRGRHPDASNDNERQGSRRSELIAEPARESGVRVWPSARDGNALTRSDEIDGRDRSAGFEP